MFAVEAASITLASLMGARNDLPSAPAKEGVAAVANAGAGSGSGLSSDPRGADRGALLRKSQEKSGANGALSAEEKQVVEQLKARDREVRDHERAHARVGGPYAGEPSYTYQAGPDGKRYAVGGEVPIDVAPVEGDPEATIDKMEVVKAAALAPTEPSGQDRKVAALADAQRLAAMADLTALRQQQKQAEQTPPANLFAQIDPKQAEQPAVDIRV